MSLSNYESGSAIRANLGTTIPFQPNPYSEGVLKEIMSLVVKAESVDAVGSGQTVGGESVRRGVA